MGFYGTSKQNKETERQGPHFSPQNLWAILKEWSSLRNFNYGRFETSYMPTGELSPERTEEAQSSYTKKQDYYYTYQCKL